MAAGTSRSLSLGLMVSQHIIQGLGGSLQWFNGQPGGPRGSSATTENT